MVPIDESPFAAIEVVNPTINRVPIDESPSIDIKVVNPPQTWFMLMNHHFLQLRLLIPP